MKKIFILFVFILLIAGFFYNSRAATDTIIQTTTIIKHDTIKVPIPYEIKISTPKKICGYSMILSGICAETFSIINLVEGGKQSSYGSYRLGFRKTGFYEINICLSIGLIAAGVSMLVK